MTQRNRLFACTNVINQVSRKNRRHFAVSEIGQLKRSLYLLHNRRSAIIQAKWTVSSEQSDKIGYLPLKTFMDGIRENLHHAYVDNGGAVSAQYDQRLSYSVLVFGIIVSVAAHVGLISSRA